MLCIVIVMQYYGNFMESKMNYEAKVYSAFCSLKTFTINGMDADEDDFIDRFDYDVDNAECGGCGDMRADVKEPETAVLEKYGISEAEYVIIATDVAEKLSFGACGWCV